MVLFDIRKIGYTYVVSMVACIVTSFMIYRLLAGWGLVHYLSVVSTVALIGGMVLWFLRKPHEGWIYLHFGFRYWSVIGLYVAFISDVFTRTLIANMKLFGIIMFVFFGCCSYFCYRNKAKWVEQFASDADKT
ncbi:MAG: hypothetical protein ACJA01_004338 [Saprospiraceae bacterium]|jgi:hypothetical protein